MKMNETQLRRKGRERFTGKILWRGNLKKPRGLQQEGRFPLYNKKMKQKGEQHDYN